MDVLVQIPHIVLDGDFDAEIDPHSSHSNGVNIYHGVIWTRRRLPSIEIGLQLLPLCVGVVFHLGWFNVELAGAGRRWMASTSGVNNDQEQISVRHQGWDEGPVAAVVALPCHPRHGHIWLVKVVQVHSFVAGLWLCPLDVSHGEHNVCYIHSVIWFYIILTSFIFVLLLFLFYLNFYFFINSYIVFIFIDLIIFSFVCLFFIELCIAVVWVGVVRIDVLFPIFPPVCNVNPIDIKATEAVLAFGWDLFVVLPK